MKINSIKIHPHKGSAANSDQHETGMPVVSTDSYIRLTFNELARTNFTHLVSSPDEEVNRTLDVAGMSYTLGGYTEWSSHGNPAISIGWDWYIEKPSQKILIAPDEVRSNLMLRTRYGYDMGQDMTSDILKLWTESIAWKSVIRSIAGNAS